MFLKYLHPIIALHLDHESIFFNLYILIYKLLTHFINFYILNALLNVSSDLKNGCFLFNNEPPFFKK